MLVSEESNPEIAVEAAAEPEATAATVVEA